MVDTSIRLVWNDGDTVLSEFWDIFGEISVENDVSNGNDVDVEDGVGAVVDTIFSSVFDIVDVGNSGSVVIDGVVNVFSSITSVCVTVSSFGVFRNLVDDAETSAESVEVGVVIISVVVDTMLW